MITNLLTSIDEQFKELNYQLKDNGYLQKLEEKINVINENINKTYHENTRLHSILKEIRHYIKDSEEDGYKLVWIDKEGKYFEAGISEILDKGSDKE